MGKMDTMGEKSIRIMQFLGLIGLERCRSFGSPYPLIISGYGQANPELRRPQGRWDTHTGRNLSLSDQMWRIRDLSGFSFWVTMGGQWILIPRKVSTQ